MLSNFLDGEPWPTYGDFIGDFMVNKLGVLKLETNSFIPEGTGDESNELGVLFFEEIASHTCLVFT